MPERSVHRGRRDQAPLAAPKRQPARRAPGGRKGGGVRSVGSVRGSQGGRAAKVGWFINRRHTSGPVVETKRGDQQGAASHTPLPGQQPGCRAACARLPGTPPLQSRGGKQETHQGELGRRSQGVAGALPSKHRTPHATRRASGAGQTRTVGRNSKGAAYPSAAQLPAKRRKQKTDLRRCAPGWTRCAAAAPAAAAGAPPPC